MNKIISKICIFISLFFLFNTSAWAKKALILGGTTSSHNETTDFVQKQVQLTGIYDSVDILKAGIDSPIPSLTQLNPYQLIVLVTGISGFKDGDAVGDILDDYMKANSNHAVLVLLPFAWYNSGFGVGGKFSNHYALMQQSSSATNAATSIDMATLVPHLLTQGITAFSCGRTCSRLPINTVNPGTQVVAKWADGTILAAYGKRRVDLNMRPVDITIDPGSYDSEGVKLIQNAVTFLGYTPLKATPESASFSQTGISNQNQMEVSFTNTTTSSLSIFSIDIEGTDKSVFQVTTKNGKPLPSILVPTQIDPMKSLDLLITFSPTSIGTFEADVMFSLGANRISYSLFGKGVDSALTISPNTIDFGAYSMIATAPKKTITITNSLSAMKTITISKIMLTDKTVFSASGAPALPLLLFPGASFDIDITFDPKGSKGLFTTRLEIESDDAGSPLILPIRARYGDPKLTLPVNNFVLSPQTVGTAGPPQSIFLSNTGDANLVLHSIISGDATFIVVNPPSMATPLTIPPGENAFFQVYFKPSMAGLKKTTVTLKGNVPDEIMNVSAEGAYPEFTMDVSPIDFETVHLGEQKVKTVTLSNTGKTNLLLESMKLDPAMMGMSTSSFSIKNPTRLPLVIPPRNNVSIEVVCAPNDTMILGDIAAKLVVTTNARTDATKQVSLKGKADGGWLKSSESPVIFDHVATYSTQTKTIQLKNEGNRTIRINKIQVTNDSEDPTNTLNATLSSAKMSVDPGQSLDLVVKFYSPMAGIFSKMVEIQTDYQTLGILLKGTTFSPQILITSMELNFPPTWVGSSSNILSTTIKNTGPIAIYNIRVVSINGPFDRIFNLLPGYKDTLQPGEETELQFTFSPTQGSSLERAQVRLMGNGLALGIITLTGSPVQPMLQVEPSEIQFRVTKETNQQRVLTTKIIHITNTSSLPIQFKPQFKSELDGFENGLFSVSWPAAFGASRITLEAGQSIDITIGFKTDEGDRNGNGNYEDVLMLQVEPRITLYVIEVKAQQTGAHSKATDDGCHITSSTSTSSGAWMVFLALIVLAYRLLQKQSLHQK